MDTGNPVAVACEALDGEFFAHSAPASTGIHEHGRGSAARSVSQGYPVDEQVFAHQGKVAQVDDERRNRRAISGNDALEQSPALQQRRTAPMDQVTVADIAGKGAPVDEQHLVAFARHEHSRGRAPAARSDNDDVVHVFLLQTW